MENPIKMDDLGVPLFSETPIYFLEQHIFYPPWIYVFVGLNLMMVQKSGDHHWPAASFFFTL